MTATTATISVASTPQIATLNVGETKKFELTGDNSYDISVTLVSITNATKITLTLKAISEQIPAVSDDVSEKTGTSDEEDQKNKNVGGEDANTQSSIWQNPILRTVAFIIVLAFIFAVIVSAIHHSRRASQKDIQNKIRVSARSRGIRVSSWFAFLS